MMKQVANFAAGCAGLGYIYGATGWVCTPARRQAQAAQYPEQAARILGDGARWDGVICYDCAQLVRAAVAAAGGYLPSGATSQWRWAGERGGWLARGAIDDLPEVAGVILYREGGGAMQHTGVYLGGGEAVDARGTREGVVRGRVDGYPWTHWAMPVVDEGEGDDMGLATVTAASGSTVNLRAAAETGAAVLERVAVGARVTVLGEGEMWSRVRTDRATGYMQTQFLTRDDGEGECVTVTLPREVALALLAGLEGAL